MAKPSQTGRCLCGAVRFEIDQPAHDADYCHCTRCQRRTGTAASASAHIDGSGFRFLAGEDLVQDLAPPGRRLGEGVLTANAAHTCSAATPTTRA